MNSKNPGIAAPQVVPPINPLNTLDILIFSNKLLQLNFPFHTGSVSLLSLQNHGSVG